MKKTRLILFSALLVIFLLMAGLAYFYFFTSVDDVIEKSPQKALMQMPGPMWEQGQEPVHLNLYWKSMRAKSFPAYNLTEYKDQELILSIFAMVAPKWDKSYAAELQSITEGRYDNKIEALAERLNERTAKTVVLFNPMPEVPVNHFPWQMKAPETYISAFQHFYSTLKNIAPKVEVIYATAGYPGSMEYYPGNKFSDGCAIVLNASAAKELKAYPPPQDLQDELKRKLHRLRFTKQPCLVLGEDLQLSNNSLSELRTGVEAQFESLAASISTTQDVAPRADLAPGFKLGVYDPQALLVNHTAVNAEHLFMNIKALNNGPFIKDFAAAVARENHIIVTAEPWGDSLGNANRNVFRDLLEGAYDHDIRALFEVLGTTNLPVYLRFAHEMEIPIERYGWQSQDPLEYIKAYRYFWDFEGGPPENVYSVWGPAGDRGSLEWYPGDDAVHFISIAIYGLPDKNIDDHRQQEQFSDIFKRKVWRMRFARAPIFITEFGVKGPDSFQRKWLENTAQTLNEHPETVGACYFNLHDNPEVWGEIETPNWSISKESFEAFVSELNLD